MALQMGALRDALMEAGASPEKAGAAAEEIAGHEAEFNRLQGGLDGVRLDIAALHSEMRVGFAELRGDLKLHNRLFGLIIAMFVAIMLKLFIH